MSAGEIERVELSAERIGEILDHAKARLEEEDYRDFENLVKSFAHVTRLLEEKRTTIGQLRKLLFGFKSEKLCKVIEKLDEMNAGEENVPALCEEGRQEGAEAPPAPAPESTQGKKKRKGHGRNGADAYVGAEREHVKHESLKSGDACPEAGCEGRVYEFVPRKIVRIVGQAPVSAKVSELEQLRCNVCLKVFTAKVPEDAVGKKYDETSASMMGLLRYGTGVPFNRLEGLQANFGIPLPASTQWDVVEAAAKRIAPAYKALVREAAQGDVLHNDDTPMKILALMKKKERKGDDG